MDKFGSDYVQVTVMQEADERHGQWFRWIRTPGPRGPVRFGVTDIDASGIDWSGGAQLSLPVRRGRELHYAVAGPASAARWLASDDPDHVDSALRAVRLSISAAHKLELAPASSLRGPAPLDRLRTHLRGAASQDVRRWRARAAIAGVSRLIDRQLREDVVQCHGGLSLASVIVSVSSAPHSLLCGEDVGRASAGHDVGWLAGELAVLATTPWLRGTDAGRRVSAMVAELIACSRWHDGTRRAALLRIALYGEDYARFVGWDEHLQQCASLLSQLQAENSWWSGDAELPLCG